MKEIYEELQLEVIVFDGGDIITESDTLPQFPITSVNENSAPDTTWTES